MNDCDRVKMYQWKSFEDRCGDWKDGLGSCANNCISSPSGFCRRQGRTGHCGSMIHQPCIAQNYNPFTMKLAKSTEALKLTPNSLVYLPRSRSLPKKDFGDDEQMKQDIKQKLLNICSKRKDLQIYDDSKDNDLNNDMKDSRSIKISLIPTNSDLPLNDGERSGRTTNKDQDDPGLTPQNNESDQFDCKSLTINKISKGNIGPKIKIEAEKLPGLSDNYSKHDKLQGKYNTLISSLPKEDEPSNSSQKCSKDCKSHEENSSKYPATRTIPIQRTQEFLRSKISKKEIIPTL